MLTLNDSREMFRDSMNMLSSQIEPLNHWKRHVNLKNKTKNKKKTFMSFHVVNFQLVKANYYALDSNRKSNTFFLQ